MKLENNEANKARFIMQYYRQNVLKVSKDAIATQLATDYFINHFPNCILTLRSIESLTEEEYKWFAHHGAYKLDDKNIVSVGKAMVKALFEPNGWSGTTIQQMCDYLRSIGILIPFMGLSTDDIIEYGWAKIKEGE